MPDTLDGLIDHTSEFKMVVSKKEIGVEGHWSNVRSVSDIDRSNIPFLHTVDADMIAYRQGKTRKGSCEILHRCVTFRYYGVLDIKNTNTT